MKTLNGIVVGRTKKLMGMLISLARQA